MNTRNLLFFLFFKIHAAVKKKLNDAAQSRLYSSQLTEFRGREQCYCTSYKAENSKSHGFLPTPYKNYHEFFKNIKTLIKAKVENATTILTILIRIETKCTDSCFNVRIISISKANASWIISNDKSIKQISFNNVLDIENSIINKKVIKMRLSRGVWPLI